MNARIFHSGDYTPFHPLWYWEHGLHDAQIISVEFIQLSCGPFRNCFKMNLDASGAVYDQTIKSIKLYHCILEKDFQKLSGSYWLQDVLTYENNKYRLALTLEREGEEFIFTVDFDTAEVER